MKIYIAGPMNGIPDLNFPAFNEVAHILRGHGHTVVNPAEVNPDPNTEWTICMFRDLAELTKCDAVYLLRGHEKSPGASIEKLWAERLGKEVFDCDGYLRNFAVVAPERVAYHTSDSLDSGIDHAIVNCAMPEADPMGKDAHTPGAKLDAGKIRPALVLGGFARALTAVSEVGTMGAAKYTDNGWTEVPGGIGRYDDAGLRHWLSEKRGEVSDKDSKLRHAAHAAWNALARLDLIIREEEQ